MKKYRSPLRDEEKLRAAAEGATSQREVLERLGLRAAGGNFKTMKESMAFFGIPIPKRDVSTYLKNDTRPDEEVFIENSTYLHGGNLKRRLFAKGFVNQCSICGQLPEWNGLPLTLQLDHINGIHNDNRLENLRIVCGHCHSQTDTFTGKNTKKEEFQNFCIDCNKKIWKNSVRCPKCNNRYKKIDPNTGERVAVQYPPHNELLDMVKEFGYTGTGKIIGTSDNAVRKRLKKYQA